MRERLFDCEHFRVWRCCAESPWGAGAEKTPRVLVCLAGDGQVEHDGAKYVFGKGDVLLLPAICGVCLCRPRGAISLLEISLPEGTEAANKASASNAGSGFTPWQSGCKARNLLAGNRANE
jgi:hypothetical protein